MKIENIFRGSSPPSNFSRACFWSELLSSHSFMIEPITSFYYKADHLEISLLLDFLNCSAIFSVALLSVFLNACLFSSIFICGDDGFFRIVKSTLRPRTECATSTRQLIEYISPSSPVFSWSSHTYSRSQRQEFGAYHCHLCWCQHDPHAV